MKQTTPFGRVVPWFFLGGLSFLWLWAFPAVGKGPGLPLPALGFQPDANESRPFREDPSQDLESLRRSLAKQIEEVKEKYQKSQKGPKATEGLESFKVELGQLQLLDLVYAQQQTIEESKDEIKADLEQVSREISQFEAIGLDSPGPYTFFILESLLDNLDDEKFRSETIASELRATKDLIEVLVENEQEVQRRRRQLEEDLEEADESLEKSKIKRKLHQAQRARLIGREMLRLRQAEHDLKQLDLNLSKQRQNIFDQSIFLVKKQVIFSADQLESHVAKIETIKLQLQEKMSETRDRLETINHRRDQAIRALGDDQEAMKTEMMESWKAARASLHQITTQINQSLADLVILDYGWNARYQIFNKMATNEVMLGWSRGVERFRRRLTDSQHLMVLQEEKARVEMNAIAKRLRKIPEDHQIRSWLNLRQEMTADWLEVVERRLIFLRNGNRLLDRWEQELSAYVQHEPLKERVARVWLLAKGWWDYELFVVDDKPITIGKLIIGFVLLIVGGYLAHWASRTLGKRLLPRLGVHEGAALAAQTISFYGLIVILSFSILELVNIPVTVVTFLGGAAAIAIGFGSQNVLNNFISGLIILGERPIRIGDLIAIDGLNGTIEHIGARSTRVRTGSNLEIIVPNSKFLENNVTNWTLSSTKIRRSVQVGVAYGSPTAKVVDLLREITEQLPQVIKQPPPIVLFDDFGDNSLNFEVHFWIHMRTVMDGRRVESELRCQIDNVFRKHQISIAFPQRDVHLDVKSPIEVCLPTPSEESSELQVISKAG